MALSTARIHRVRGRPPLLAAGIKSLIHSHSSSVKSLGYVFSFIYPCYTTHEDFSDRLLGHAPPVTGHLSALRVAVPQHNDELPRREGYPCVRAGRPPRKVPLRESLHHDPVPLAVIEQQRERGAGAVAQDVDGPLERVRTACLTTDRRQAINAFTKIHRLRGEKAPALWSQVQQERPSTKARTNASNSRGERGGCRQSRVPSTRASSSWGTAVA